jgi:DnaJ-class molecular chaperone
MPPQSSQDPAAKTMSRPGDEVPPGTPGSGDDVCPRCHGSGTIDSQGCEYCSGTGMITRAIGGA